MTMEDALVQPEVSVRNWNLIHFRTGLEVNYFNPTYLQEKHAKRYV